MTHKHMLEILSTIVWYAYIKITSQHFDKCNVSINSNINVEITLSDGWRMKFILYHSTLTIPLILQRKWIDKFNH